MADTQLILHVKGTDQTTALPKQIVRAGIAQGQISYSQLIWSPIHAAWKQVREMPHLWPSQKIAPAPDPRPVAAAARPPVSAPRFATPAVVPAHGRPKVVPSVKVSAPPKVAVLGAGQTPETGTQSVPRVQARVAPGPQAAVVLPKDDMPLRIAKWLSIVVGTILCLLVAVNGILVDRPLALHLADSPFGQVSVFAHLGALVQPDAIVIHVLPSSTINESNLGQFLTALAACTPPRLGSDDPYDRVSLTSGLVGHYTFAGGAWEDLGKLANSPDEQEDFILSHIDDAAGQPLAALGSGAETRDRVWAGLLHEFGRP